MRKTAATLTLLTLSAALAAAQPLDPDSGTIRETQATAAAYAEADGLLPYEPGAAAARGAGQTGTQAQAAGARRRSSRSCPKAKKLKTIENFAPFLDKEEVDGGFARVAKSAPVVVILKYAPPPAPPHDPLVFDLHGDGVRTSSQKVKFDIDGDGKPDLVNDISVADGILVFDADGDGISGESGLELFGDGSDINGDGKRDGLPDGFKALEALANAALFRGLLTDDALADRRLDAGELAVLEKEYGLKVVTGGFHGEELTLAEAGIAAVELPRRPAERVKNYDSRGNDLTRSVTAMFLRRNGSKGTYSNVWLAAKAPPDSMVADQFVLRRAAPGKNLGLASR